MFVFVTFKFNPCFGINGVSCTAASICHIVVDFFLNHFNIWWIIELFSLQKTSIQY